ERSRDSLQRSEGGSGGCAASTPPAQSRIGAGLLRACTSCSRASGTSLTLGPHSRAARGGLGGAPLAPPSSIRCAAAERAESLGGLSGQPDADLVQAAAGRASVLH